MNKRRFLKSLIGIAGAAAAAPVVAKLPQGNGLPADHPYAGMSPSEIQEYLKEQISCSQPIVLADQFAVMQNQDSEPKQIFAVGKDGNVYINEAMVKDASIRTVRVAVRNDGVQYIAGFGRAIG